MQGKSLTASIAKQAAIKANAIQRRNRQEDNIVKEWYLKTLKISGGNSGISEFQSN